jgi:DNA anti-recombination protein RmuC
VLLSTRIGLRFIYGYIVAKRKGLVEQFVQQQAEEFSTTRDQIRQLVDEIEKLLGEATEVGINETS